MQAGFSLRSIGDRLIEHWSVGPGAAIIVGIIGGFWSATLWNNGPGIPTLAGIGVFIRLFGRVPVAAWMTLVAALPTVGVASGYVPLRMFAATLNLITWSLLMAEMVFHDGVLRPTMGGCAACLVASLQADLRLAGMMAQRRASAARGC